MNPRSTDPASLEWATKFQIRAQQKRIPIAAMLELTSRCNLRCQHCYLGDQSVQHARRQEERSTEEVKASLREWVDAGCLYLLITGGDPMMRKDFAEIYRTACELGMVVSIFCDGILVDDAIIRLFKEYPPRKVEISIYGAVAETYELVTRVPHSYEKAWAGIDLLCRNGIRVGLKTVLLTLNEQELSAMEAQAAKWNLPFRYDAAVFPCLPGGSNHPLDLRVAPEKVVAHDLATPERRQQWKEKVEKINGFSMEDRLYTCGAGASGFFADPYGALSPCLMTVHYKVEQGGRSFQEVWDTDLSAIQKKKKTRMDGCLTGEMRGACTHCPAMNFMETGDEEVESNYVAKTTELRHDAVKSLTGSK